MVIMNLRSVKFVIDSNLENVTLVGMSVNRLCSSASFSDIDCYNIELCVVEAVTNSIRHSYGGEHGHEVKVVFTLTQEDVILDVYDNGPPMNPELLDKADIMSSCDDRRGIECIPEGGRGLGIIKAIMDAVAYGSEKGENRLTMRKKLPEKGESVE
jgi:serine/threonine-protein kinase RsbW